MAVSTVTEAERQHVPVTFMQCRVQFWCQGLPGFVLAFPACSNHVKSKWCNVQSYPVLFPWLYQLMHAHRGPTQKLTTCFMEDVLANTISPGKAFCGGSAPDIFRVPWCKNKCFHRIRKRAISLAQLKIFLLNPTFFITGQLFLCQSLR